MSAFCARFQTSPKCWFPSCHYRLINNMCSNVRTLRGLGFSVMSLAEPAGVVSVDSGGLHAWDFQADCWQSWAVTLSDECQLAVSLTVVFFSSSLSMSSHHGRPRETALWSRIMKHGEYAAPGWLLTVAAAPIAWMMENQWDLILVCHYEY